MLNFGIIGMNEGNGHPYSFSAIFNGYSEEYIDECPFSAIKTYLPGSHRNEVIIPDANISHVWTQEVKLSESVAKVAKIPNIVDHYEDMIGKVDAIILARDDPHNHWEMSKPFIEAGLPIYIDKILADNMDDLNRIIGATGYDYPLLCGSSSMYTPLIEKAKKEIVISKVKGIYGISHCTWIRYAPHLLDGICHVFGNDIKSVQNIGQKGNAIVKVNFVNGLIVVLQIIEEIEVPISFTCYTSEESGPCTVLFDDDGFKSYFMGFYNMLNTFTQVVKTGKPVVPIADLVQLSKVVIAGEMSLQNGGREVSIDEL